MANSEPAPNPTPPPRHFAPLPGLLSYLVPGLGQIVQGRVGKGLLFFVSLYGLFFYGLYLGNWHNVYVPDTAGPRGDRTSQNSRWLDALTDRARFAGQFWIGAAAWPAILQYVSGTPYVEMPDGSRGKIAYPPGPNAPLVPTVYSPTFPPPNPNNGLAIKKRTPDEVEVDIGDKTAVLPIRGLPVLGTFMGEPDEPLLNDEIRASDKKWELGWMYTVIAGVLNILVIYDAFAGPAFGVTAARKPAPEGSAPAEQKKEEAAAVA
jgi:hypothetical protein